MSSGGHRIGRAGTALSLLARSRVLHTPALSSAQRMVDILNSSGGLRGAALSLYPLCRLGLTHARALAVHSACWNTYNHHRGERGLVRHVRCLLFNSLACACRTMVVHGAHARSACHQVTTAVRGLVRRFRHLLFWLTLEHARAPC